MLKLVKAGTNDILYDLGCGWAQNLLIASTEFGVKNCVGIEKLKSRHAIASQRVRKRGLTKRVRVLRGNYEQLFTGKIPNADLSKATIVVHALTTGPKFIDDLSRILRQNCRVVYYNLTLSPEIKPSAVDYPFYVSKFPFDIPISEVDWLTSVIPPSGNMAPKTAKVLWNELVHDYNVEGVGKSAILDYQRRLKVVLRKP